MCVFRFEPVARVEVPADGRPMRPRLEGGGWEEARPVLQASFGYSDESLAKYEDVSTESLRDGYEMMQSSFFLPKASAAHVRVLGVGGLVDA